MLWFVLWDKMLHIYYSLDFFYKWIHVSAQARYMNHRDNAGREKKEEIWLSPMTKAPTPTEKSKKQRDNTKKRHQKLRLHIDCGPT